MRNFVELPGGSKRIKRLTDRKAGNYDRPNDGDDGDFYSGRDAHDSRRARRESRQLMRRIVGGEDFPTDE